MSGSSRVKLFNPDKIKRSKQGSRWILNCKNQRINKLFDLWTSENEAIKPTFHHQKSWSWSQTLQQVAYKVTTLRPNSVVSVTTSAICVLMRSCNLLYSIIPVYGHGFLGSLSLVWTQSYFSAADRKLGMGEISQSILQKPRVYTVTIPPHSLDPRPSSHSQKVWGPDYYTLTIYKVCILNSFFHGEKHEQLFKVETQVTCCNSISKTFV